mmetsp:Transcript_53029/g.85836  ORF Transcript_53029/g.85836 Transcript_53029/m.85836 type:complete len:202 (-) Transcript_53029:336-941(-)
MHKDHPRSNGRAIRSVGKHTITDSNIAHHHLTPFHLHRGSMREAAAERRHRTHTAQRLHVGLVVVALAHGVLTGGDVSTSLFSSSLLTLIHGGLISATTSVSSCISSSSIRGSGIILQRLHLKTLVVLGACIRARAFIQFEPVVARKMSRYSSPHLTLRLRLPDPPHQPACGTLVGLLVVFVVFALVPFALHFSRKRLDVS